MAIVNPPYAQQNASHSALLFRQVVASEYGAIGTGVNGLNPNYNYLFGQGVGSGNNPILIGTGGVIGASDLAVTQHTGTDMNVSVATGACVIPRTSIANGGLYYCTTDNAGSVVVPIATASGANFRNDVIIAQAIDTQYGGASNTWQIVSIAGTLGASASASITNALGSNPNSIALAVVYVGISVTGITNANITDARPFAAPGGDTGWLVQSTGSGFTNSWTQSGANTVKSRTINRVTYVEGVLAVTGTSGTAAFTLPAGIGWPTQTIYRPSFGAGTGVNMNLKIDTSGVVTPSWISGTPTTVGLGFSYPIL